MPAEYSAIMWYSERGGATYPPPPALTRPPLVAIRITGNSAGLTDLEKNTMYDTTYSSSSPWTKSKKITPRTRVRRLSGTEMYGAVTRTGDVIFSSAYVEHPRAHDENGRTWLHVAAAAGRTKSIRRLLRDYAEVNSRDKAGKTPLMWAALFGRIHAVEALLQAGADPHARDNLGWTALAWFRSRPRERNKTNQAIEDLLVRAMERREGKNAH